MRWEPMASRHDCFCSAFFVCFLLQGSFPVKRTGLVGCGNPVGVWKCHSSSCMVNFNDFWADFVHFDHAKSQPNVSCTEICNADMDLRVSIVMDNSNIPMSIAYIRMTVGFTCSSICVQRKWFKCRVLYYPNFSATFNSAEISIILSVDVHPLPGPSNKKIAIRIGNRQSNHRRYLRGHVSTNCIQI